MVFDKGKTPLFVAAIAGVVLAVGVATFAGPCIHEDGSTSVCSSASHALMVCGVVTFVAGIAGSVAKGGMPAKICSIIAVVAGMVSIIAPGSLFPLCMMQTMRCWTVMRPYSLLCGIAVVACAVVQLVMASRKKES